jgi:hypothetical protein
MVDALLDSGFIYAAFNVNDNNHARCINVIQRPSQRILLPSITLPEVAFLVRRSEGSHKVATIIQVLRQSPFRWIDPALEDYDRAAQLIEQYRDAKLDLVDCVITAMAERLTIQRILTLDRRDFSLIKPMHCPAFELLP